jgi:SAM-dependent methyltransferase
MPDISNRDHATATAYKAWDLRWSMEQGRADWISPEKDVIDLCRELERRETVSVLDLGCGIGRHALFLASLGFKVFATDASPNGLAVTERAVQEAGFQIDCRPSLMTLLPYPDNFFDYVLAWNVIYHGTPDIVMSSVGEVQRVLRAGGLFQGTLLSKRDTYYGKGRQIDRNTFILETDDEEKIHPHFYCDAKELLSLFGDFEIISLRLCEQKRQGSFHWNFVVEKLEDL